MSAEVKESLKIFRKYIENILRPSYVVGNMSNWLTSSVTEQIVAEERKGPTAAAVMFMDKLLELEAEGWYQGFKDALFAEGYSGLSEALEKSNFDNIERLEEPKKWLNMIYSTIRSNIKTEELLPNLNHCLMPREIEEIQQETRMKGTAAGAEKLIQCLLRSDKTEWPKVFTLALEEADCTPVLQLWNNDKECGKKCQSVEDPGEGTSALMMVQFSEEPMIVDTCLSGAVESNSEHTVKMIKLASYFPTSVKTMKLRKYQEELAQPAYSGKNTIVCAPTGSGKTFVALSICEHHLKSRPEGQRGKIVFMATKVPVYEQQKEIFRQYFQDTEYSVEGFSGEETENLPVGLIIENNDIIILTPQILVNCLNSGYVPSLSIFTMMIFDECHNTIGNHPYNILMFAYLDLKLGSPRQVLPQIIGLTASVGIGKSQCTVDAVQYISKLCASLDIEVISTVKQNMEELQKVVCKPEKFIREPKHRERDPFIVIMSKIMAETEQMAKSVYPSIETMSNIQNRTFGSQNYEQWIIDIQQKCRTLQLEDKVEESRLCNALFIYTEHLKKFNDSLMINDDARTKDALNYLENFFNNIQSGPFTDIEQQLARKFKDNLPLLIDISNDNENPKLEELQFIILESYHENPETRTLLFVKTRALVVFAMGRTNSHNVTLHITTQYNLAIVDRLPQFFLMGQALKKWIEETPALQFLKPEMLIGRNKRHDNTGMTLQSQKGALETFKISGESKLLIATSVADEGIDIPACNLVLLYEYVGNVTKMIQVRGRGRAKDSKCFLITSKREQAEKERYNLLHEQLMNEAVAQLQKQDTDDFVKQNLISQRNEKKLRDFTKNSKGLELTEENKRLICGRCKTFACNTDDIRTINSSHHTVIDKDFKDKYYAKLHSKPNTFNGFEKRFKIFCKNPKCGDDWGVAGNYLSFQNIPLIKIDKFVVENADGSQIYFRKWVKVDFRMKEFKQEEIQESFSVNSE